MRTVESLFEEGLPIAKLVAYGQSKKKPPYMRELYQAEAVLACWRLAQRYDPEHGLPWTVYLRRMLPFKIVDGLREIGVAHRHYTETRFQPVSLEAHNEEYGVEQAGNGVLHDNKLPVGWELEREEEVEAIARGLPPRHGKVVRALLMEAGLTQKAYAERVGQAPEYVSRVRSEAAALLTDAQKKRVKAIVEDLDP
jgi:DNA-directed RNA polymerase specialized sigma subunit